jgi:hypothetical protein
VANAHTGAYRQEMVYYAAVALSVCDEEVVTPRDCVVRVAHLPADCILAVHAVTDHLRHRRLLCGDGARFDAVRTAVGVISWTCGVVAGLCALAVVVC